MFHLKDKEEGLKGGLWDPLSRLPTPYVLQTREQEEPGTKRIQKKQGLMIVKKLSQQPLTQI
jgi:hypothetical protein